MGRRVLPGLMMLLLVFSIAAAAPAQEVDIEREQNLSFGVIIPGRSGGTVTITPEGEVETTGSVIYLGGGHPAEFVAERQRSGRWWDLTVLEEEVTITGPDDQMPVESFELDPDTVSAGRVGTTELIRAGATLSVGPGQPGGDYGEGYFTIITVDR